MSSDSPYHWSLIQVEYSTDLVFRSDAILKSLYEELSRQAIFSVKAEQVATFLGKKITPQLAQELGSRFTTRIEGTCIKHHLGKVSVKMYDKFNRVLRLETTTNNVAFFKHHRKVRAGPGNSDRRISGSLAPTNGCVSSHTRSKSMARRTRRNHTPAFKAQVALAALKSDKTLAELAQQYDIHPNQITDWKRQLTERAVQVFGDASSPASSDPDLTKLHAKIGQLALENDFLEHALTKAGLLSARR